MRSILIGLLIVALPACRRSSSSNFRVVTPPAGAFTSQLYVTGWVLNVAALSTHLRGLMGTLLDPEAREQAGYTFEPDPDPDAPENSYIYEIPFDLDGDGLKEGTIRGSTILSGDPFPAPSVGFSGTVDIEIEFGEERSIGGLFDFRLDEDGVRIWGTGTSTDTGTDQVTEFTITEEGAILVEKPPEGSGEQGNLCSVDVEGPVQVQTLSPAGIYAAILDFLFGSTTVDFKQAFFAETEEDEMTRVGDGRANLHPCREPSITDWEGIFILDWFCNPPESGQSRLTFTVTGPNTVHVSDEHPIGSGLTIEFDVTSDDGNPHILRGSFLENDGPGTYREDVVFTLAPNGQSWNQDNEYVYIDGELEGFGGACFGTGTRTGG